MMKRRQPHIRANERANQRHQIECWVQSAYFASRGTLLLLHALHNQQRPYWKRQHRRAQKAVGAFTEAARWAEISLQVPYKRSGKQDEER